MTNTIKVYDNGGKTLDRYTIFLDDSNDCIGADERGVGFYQHCSGIRGKHLGKIIPFESLDKMLQDKLTNELGE
jgi:hypothetical protein